MSNAQAVLTMYDRHLWESAGRQALELPRCTKCGRFRYPPGPICPHCLSMDYEWTVLSGRARILSWVVFHRKYFDDYPPPYNVVAIELAEGPIMVTNLVGIEPAGSWIGADVALCYEPHGERMLPRVRLCDVIENGAVR